MLECSRGIDELAQWSLLQLSYEWSLLGQGSDTSNTNIMNSAITLNGSPSVKTITPTRPRCRRQASSRSGLYRHGCLDANLHPRSRQLRRSGTYATFTNGLISAATRIPHQVVDTPRLSTRPTTGPRPGNVGFQARDFRPHLRLTTTPRNGNTSIRPSRR